ncbi:hypothetical protein ACFL51_01665 [Myxococcota bacterium]
MSNGTDPGILRNEDYQTIKGGTCVTSGRYEGCIKVGTTHYWIMWSRTGYWVLRSGATPDSNRVKIGSDVWDKCKDGGSYDWLSEEEAWKDPATGKAYRWAGEGGSYVNLVEVEL